MGTPIGKVGSKRTRSELECSGLKVSNIVATADLKREFDLVGLSKSLPEADYDPEFSPFLLFRTEEATVMIPRTGKISIVGADRIDDTLFAFDSLVDLLSDLDVSIKETTLVVENLVVNGSIEVEVELPEVAVALGLTEAEYEPEQFPGLIYRPAESATILLFRTGSYIITGLTNYDDVWTAARDFTEELDERGVPNIDSGI